MLPTVNLLAKKRPRERNMSKAAEMARVSAKGGFHVLWGLVISTVISAIGTIIIAIILGPDNYGLYTIALTAPNLIIMFRDWGINTAIVKYSAQYNSEGNVAKIRNIFVSSLIFEIIVGLLLSALTFVLSGFLATLLQRPTIVPLIQIASFSVLAGALVTVATAAFTGMETMHLNSIMLIIQSVVKTVLIIGLVLLGLGTLGGITGFTLASVVAGIAGLLLIWTMYRSLPKLIAGKLEFMLTIKTLIRYGLPVSIGTILVGFLTVFWNYILAIYVTNNSIIGNYNVANNFVVLITFFSMPVTTMLLPAFSKLDPKKDTETLKNIFQSSVKYASLIVVPVTTMVIALSQPGIRTIFQNSYTEAPFYLALLSVTYIFTALGNLSASNLIVGQGYTTFSLKTTILTVAIGFPLGFLLTFQFGVIGLVVAMLTSGLPSIFLSLRFIKRHFGVSVDWVSSGKIILSSAIAAILTYLIIFKLPVHSLIQLIIGVSAFVIIFILIAVFTRTISIADMTNLRLLSGGLGPLSKPVNYVLDIIEKLMKALRPEKDEEHDFTLQE